jgi:hypothetical protein
MAYYPKNKIKTGLFANPGEFALRSDQVTPYSGTYWSRADGKYFTNNPNDPTSQEIIKVIFDNSGDSTPSSLASPVDYSPMLPTEDDYKFGEFTRYFTVRVNQPIFIEVSEDTYNEYVKNQTKKLYVLYKPFSLKWVLTGNFDDVYRANKTSVLVTEQSEKIIGLQEYLLENYSQYYK